MRQASSCGAREKSGFLLSQSRWIGPHLEMRWGTWGFTWVMAGTSGFLWVVMGISSPGNFPTQRLNCVSYVSCIGRRILCQQLAPHEKPETRRGNWNSLKAFKDPRNADKAIHVIQEKMSIYSRLIFMYTFLHFWCILLLARTAVTPPCSYTFQWFVWSLLFQSAFDFVYVLTVIVRNLLSYIDKLRIKRWGSKTVSHIC